MDVRLVVSGLLSRNAVLSALLMNYVERLEQERFGRCASTRACFIVPTWWNSDAEPPAPVAADLLTVAVHAPRTDPDHGDNLDRVLGLLHMVLTDDHAGASITARRLYTSDDRAFSDRGTAVRMGIWEIAPVLSRPARSTHARLLPWPACSAPLDAGGLAPGTVSLN